MRLLVNERSEDPAADDDDAPPRRDPSHAFLRLAAPLVLLLILAVELTHWFLPSSEEVRARVQDATQSTLAVELGDATSLIFLVDTFSGGKRDHGDLMAEALIGTAPTAAAIARIDLGPALKTAEVVRSLERILAFAREQKALPIVVNMSFGSSALSEEERTLLTALDPENVILVAAAGNEGVAAPHYPAAFAPVIAVGNANDLGRVASSNFGPWVDVSLDGWFNTAVGNEKLVASGGHETSWTVETGTSFSAARASGLLAGVTRGRRLGSDDALRELLAAADVARGGFVRPFRVRFAVDASFRWRLAWRAALIVGTLLVLRWVFAKRPEPEADPAAATISSS